MYSSFLRCSIEIYMYTLSLFNIGDDLENF